MSKVELKLELIHWLTETDDETVLNRIEAIRMAHSQSEADEAVLRERIEKYKTGEIRFSTWEEVKNRIQVRGQSSFHFS